MSLRVRPSGVETLPESDAAVLAALWAVYSDLGRATIREVAAEADRAISTTYVHLAYLAELGLVAGLGDGTHGALRPLVWPVSV